MLQGDKKDMRDLAETAQRLRLVKQATRDFLSRWAMNDPMDDDSADKAVAVATQASEIADYKNHDWSQLYRGSVLDD